MGGRHERLHLHEERARAFERGDHGGSGNGAAAIPEQALRGIFHLREAVPAHLEHSDLVRGPEAVLRRAQDPVLVVRVPFEVEHHVHHVLERARPRHRAVLGHVPDQHDGDRPVLGETQEPEPALAHLGHAPGRRAQLRKVEGLDGVDHEEGGLKPVHLRRDRVEIDLGMEIEVVGAAPERDPLGAHLGLPRRFLPRDVEHHPPVPRERARELERQGGFSDSRISPDQDERAGDQPSAQHAVQLPDARAVPLLREGLDLAEPRGPRRSASVAAARRRCRGALRFLHRGVPFTAMRAPSEPLGAVVSARGAKKDRADCR